MESLAPGGDDLKEVIGTLRRIAETAQRFLSADICIISATNPITGQFIAPPIVAGTLEDGDPVLVDRAWLDELTRHVQEHDAIFIGDLAAHTSQLHTASPFAGVRSLAAVELRTELPEKLLAVLCLLYKTPRQFSEEERDLLFMSTDAAIPVLRHAWLMQRYRTVARIGQEINQDLETIDMLFQKLQSHVADILDISHFFLLAAYQPQTNSLDLYMSRRGVYSSQENVPLTGGCRYVIEEQRDLVIERLSDLSGELTPPIIPLPGTSLLEESLVFIPLSLRGVPFGVLSVQHTQPYVYDAEDVHILKLLGNYIALALSNIRLYDNVRWLNEAGQFLTQQLDSDQVLQGVVDQICMSTKADIVVLFPYEQELGLFQRPPRRSGELLEPGFRSLDYSRPDDIAALTVEKLEPVFARDSVTLYTDLGGDPNERRGNFAEREQISSTAGVPLRVGNEPVGVLFVNFRRPQRFDAPQKQLIWGLANYAAIAIKNSREFGALTRRRVQELELLRMIDREISRTLDLQQVMQAILNLTTAHIPVDAASILLYEPRTELLKMEAAVGLHARTIQPFALSVEGSRGLTRRVFSDKQPVRVGNVQTDPKWRAFYVKVETDGAVATNTLSEMDVPLLEQDEVVGVINFESMRENAFSQADEDFVVTVAERAVLAVKNAQAYQRELRIAEERRALVEISKQIIRDIDTEHIFELILDRALEVTNSKVGTLRLYDSQRKDLFIVAERGVLDEQKSRRLGLDDGIVGWVATHKQPLNVDDVESPDWSAIFLASIPGIRSELAVPLLEGDTLRGVLNIESPLPRHFDDGDERLLTALADLSIITLQTIERYKQAQEGNAHLRALYEVDQSIISQLDDPNQVMKTILKHALSLIGVKIADLDLYEGDRPVATYLARLDDQRQVLPIRQIDGTEASAQGIERGIIAHVAATRKPYRTTGDAQDDPHYKGERNIHSEVAVPLLSKPDELIGVLNLESRRPYVFDEKSVELLESLANQAVIAIQNARNYKSAQVERERFRLLHGAGQELARITDLEQLNQAYDIVLQIVERHFSSHAVIRRYDEATQELRMARAGRYTDALSFEPVKRGEGVNGAVAERRQTIVMHDVTKPSRDGVTAKPSDPKTRSLVITPIQFGTHYYGNLGLSHERVGYFRDADVDLVEGLAQQLAITIHRLETVQARQEAEQRAREAEIMGTFGQMGFELAHRLGNDLGLVRSYVNNVGMDMQAQGIVSDSISAELEKIVRDVGRVLGFSVQLKKDLAEFKEVGAVSRDRAVMPAQVVFDEARNVLPPIPAHVRLIWEPVPNTIRVKVALGQIIDILVNLVTNAVAAIPASGGTITLRAHSAGRYVDLEVIDTGSGIAPDRISQIFDLFYSTKGSSGFGLWSARRNALANGGDLRVKSELGQGTSFTLRLPRSE